MRLSWEKIFFSRFYKSKKNSSHELFYTSSWDPGYVNILRNPFARVNFSILKPFAAWKFTVQIVNQWIFEKSVEKVQFISEK